MVVDVYEEATIFKLILRPVTAALLQTKSRSALVSVRCFSAQYVVVRTTSVCDRETFRSFLKVQSARLPDTISLSLESHFVTSAIS